MRKRNIEIKLRFTDEEFSKLENLVSITNLTREEFIRRAIQGVLIQPYPPADVPYLLREYKRIGNNLNQVLIIANTKGFLDVPRLRSVMDELQKMDELVYKTYAGVKQ